MAQAALTVSRLRSLDTVQERRHSEQREDDAWYARCAHGGHEDRGQLEEDDADDRHRHTEYVPLDLLTLQRVRQPPVALHLRDARRAHAVVRVEVAAGPPAAVKIDRSRQGRSGILPAAASPTFIRRSPASIRRRTHGGRGWPSGYRSRRRGAT